MLARRSLLLGASGLPLLGATPATYHLPVLRTEDVQSAPPAGQRVPFGWKALALNKPIFFGFRALVRGATVGRFRLALAVDSREISQVEVYLAQGGWDPAVMDLRYPGPFQIFEIELDPDATKAALKGGIGIRRVSGQAPLSFFAPESTGGTTPEELQPHLMLAGDESPRKEFGRRLLNLAGLQPFGWKLGCVLDGLLAMEKELGGRNTRKALDRIFSLYFPDGRKLVYEGPRSEPLENSLYGVEAPLPFGALARHNPKHPALELLAEFARKRAQPDGVIPEGNGVLKTEECYTVAYPLAVLGSQRKDAELLRLAAIQLRARRDLLVTGDAIYQRGKPGDLIFRNWARGMAWYLLGLARSLEYLPPTPDLEDAFRQGAALAMRLQGEDGLWSCFAEERSTGAETSGSAGIAAALALGAGAKRLDKNAREAAVRASSAIEKYLTPDGLLGGVSQENRGGEELQRSGYWCKAQFGMGLYAQLIGALS